MLRGIFINAILIIFYGAEGIASFTICINTTFLAAIFINGACDTVLPITGVLFGEKDYIGMRMIMKFAIRFILLTCGILMLLYVTFSRNIALLFGITEAGGIRVADIAIKLYALSLPFYGINILRQNFFQTTGRVRIAVISAFCNSLAFTVLTALIIAPTRSNALWCFFLVAEALTFLIIQLYNKARINQRDMFHQDNKKSWNISINTTVEATTMLSKDVYDLCLKNGTDLTLANQLSIIIEEMTSNIAIYGNTKAKSIDVSINFFDDQIVISVKDDGISFDPTVYKSGEATNLLIGGIDLAKAIASSISYSRVLGFNCTTITLEKKLK